MYRNYEGYSDPTAGQAVGQIMREYKKQRKKWNYQHDMKNRRKVYVASKYAGNIDENVAKAVSYCRYVINKNCMPVASHLMYPGILDDSIPTEREMGLLFGLALLAVCDEVWCFGEISPGMEHEIREANKLGKRVRYLKEVA